MACLDTSILVDLSRKGDTELRRRAREKVKSLVAAGDPLMTTLFNAAELWVGVERASEREKEESAVAAVLEPLVILDFDERAARIFARVLANLLDEGRHVGDMDALIGSVALASGQSIVTRNSKHFDDIPGLRVETY